MAFVTNGDDSPPHLPPLPLLHTPIIPYIFREIKGFCEIDGPILEIGDKCNVTNVMSFGNWW